MITKGQKINDRYQIIRTIGEGGMANVYLAHDIILDRYVAVKILRGDLATDEKFVKRFQREAISASSLSHPNIVEMYDVGEDNGQYFIVMEYVDGKTLKSLIKKRGALTVPEVIDIMMQLTAGIMHAHDSYIIHRDIKPQNVLILEDGRVKITDFGIAMAMNSQELTQTNSVMGSVHYLPPEQASGSGSTIKSDVYSLGILMYELLVGKVPFKGENAVEIALKQMKEPIPSVIAVNPDIPQSLENIILRACAKNPKNRYDTVSEMREDLRTALDPLRQEERRIVYSYPEQELEETKRLPELEHLTRSKKEIVREDGEKTEKKKNKRVNIILIVVASICLGLASLIAIFAIVVPKVTEVPEIKIPDVANMSVVDAEKKLKDAGFEVEAKTEEKNDSKIKEGMVIGTNPVVGRTVKKGTAITIIVSLGEKGLVLENYVGRNYLEVKGILEANGIYVIIEKKDVTDKTTKENTIIAQSPTATTKVVEGDTVTLTIPDIITEYPDFVKEKWTLNDVQAFCTQYGLILETQYEETKEYQENTVISQSRKAGDKVVTGVTLVVKIAMKPTEDPAAGSVPGA